jgi:hypothetical protein
VLVNNLGPWFGGLQWRRLGPYPIADGDQFPEDSGYSEFNLDLGYKIGSSLKLQLSLYNLFNTHAHSSAYDYTSRVRGEPLDGVDGLQVASAGAFLRRAEDHCLLLIEGMQPLKARCCDHSTSMLSHSSAQLCSTPPPPPPELAVAVGGVTTTAGGGAGAGAVDVSVIWLLAARFAPSSTEIVSVAVPA